ncbi:MAG TPA: hypothetical protein VMH80_22045, partial [Bryobacteraceae bacterium]|nr:hypothetical protein [Bryobacteraceae bacterium]
RSSIASEGRFFAPTGDSRISIFDAVEGAQQLAGLALVLANGRCIESGVSGRPPVPKSLRSSRDPGNESTVFDSK